MPLRNPGCNQPADVSATSVDDKEHVAQHFSDRLISEFAIRSRILAFKNVAGEHATDVGKVEAAQIKHFIALDRIVFDDPEPAVG